MNIGENEISFKYQTDKETEEENRCLKNFNSEILSQTKHSDIVDETSNNFLEKNKKLAVSNNDYEIKINKDQNFEKTEADLENSKNNFIKII